MFSNSFGSLSIAKKGERPGVSYVLADRIHTTLHLGLASSAKMRK